MKKKILINNRAGFVTVLLLLVVIAMAILFSGVLFGPKFTPGTGSPLTTSALCCDTGDGAACKPQTGAEKTLTYAGQGYGLLKSNITLSEGVAHLKDSGQKFGNDPIILNTSDGYNPPVHGIQCDGEAVWGPRAECVRIPNDQIVYVCKDKCGPSNPEDRRTALFCDQNNCYGSADTVYDAYFRLADYPSPGVPKEISECAKTTVAGQPKIVSKQYSVRKNLQLETFEVVLPQGGIPWFSPWCKPAIYLYPEETSYVNVGVNSSEPFIYTDPLYPEGGWSVLTDSTGILNYSGKFYDYLYYETKVADSDVAKPNEGFVVAYGELSELLSSLLPKLGLNDRETKQFKDYWLKALPKANFYFVGVVSQNTIKQASTLSIIPAPQTEIRVTLYFESMEQRTGVPEPTIITPIRTGFTVVEWGGIFKRQPNQTFSCFE